MQRNTQPRETRSRKKAFVKSFKIVGASDFFRASVADPDPNPDPHVLGLLDPDPDP
jgi:hypothetical protein